MLEYKKIKLKEVDQVYKLYCQEESMVIEPMAIEKARKIYSLMLANDSYTFACFKDEKIIAVVNVNKILDYYPDYQNAPYVHLETIIVAKEYQGQGIGTQLLTECIKLLKTEGVTYIIGQSKNPTMKSVFIKAGLIDQSCDDFRVNFIK